MKQLNLTSSGVEDFAGAFEKLLIELLALNMEASNEEIVGSAVKLMAGFEGISHEPLTEMRNNPDFQNYARLFRASLEEKDTDEDSEAAGV
jgi:hypothetical protein